VKWRDLLSWDLFLAATLATGARLLLPAWTSNALAKDLYGLGVTVLSIVFAVFFTALAVIMTAGGDEFVSYLRHLGVYRGIMQTFQYNLVLLFVALMYAVSGFAVTAAAADRGWRLQSSWFVVGFTFFFLYGLFAVIDSTNDAVRWSHYRIVFLEKTKAMLPPTGGKSGDGG
jgi:hypothetical protein